jgi:hypothetical protein
MSIFISLCSLLCACYSAGSFQGCFLGVCSHEQCPVLCVVCSAFLQLDLSELFRVSALIEHVSVLCSLLCACYSRFFHQTVPRCLLMSLYQFSLFCALRFATALVLSGLSLGVCSHEHFSFLSLFCSALPTAGSFTRRCPVVCSHELCQFSLFSALRFLQRWFFPGVVLGVCSHEHFSFLFSVSACWLVLSPGCP